MWARLDTGWRLAIGLAVGQRLVLGVVAFLAQLDSSRDIGGEWGPFIIRGGEPWSFLLSTWQRGDALWYQKIAEQGYQVGDTTVTYYPLFPLLTRILAGLPPLHVVSAGLILSSVACVLALRLLYDLALFDTNPGKQETSARAPDGPARRRALLTVLLLALFPSGFFLAAPMTESLFLLLTVGAFWLARRQLWWKAGCLGFLAALARANGLALALPLAWEAFRPIQVSPTPKRIPVQRYGWMLFLASMPLVGAGVWIIYVRNVVGEERATVLGGAFGRVQAWLFGTDLTSGGQRPRDWQLVTPWDAIGSSLDYLRLSFLGLRTVAPFEIPGVELLNLVGLLGFCALGILVLRWLPLAYGLYLWPNLLVLLTRKLELQPLLSTNRIILVLFPCFMVLAMLLVRFPHAAFLWLAASAGLQIFLMTQLVQWRFIA